MDDESAQLHRELEKAERAKMTPGQNAVVNVAITVISTAIMFVLAMVACALVAGAGWALVRVLHHAGLVGG